MQGREDSRRLMFGVMSSSPFYVQVRGEGIVKGEGNGVEARSELRRFDIVDGACARVS